MPAATVPDPPEASDDAPVARTGGDQGGPCDHETEGEHPPADLQRPRPDRVTEDQDAADDRREVGCNRGEGDDLDARADLQAPG